jgi:hypothetical protein
MSTVYRPVGRGVYPLNRRQAGQLGPATLRVSNLLAIGSVLFGAACAAFVPASLEQRIGAVFLFGLIPAIAFHGGGLLLSLLFGYSSELAERIAKLCFRYFARLVSATLPVLNAERSCSSVEYLSERIRLMRIALRSLDGVCRRLEGAIFEFSCLMIRSAARFMIRLQAWQRLKRCR